MGRPLSGKSAPKGRMSLIDRVAGGSYTPPAPQPLAMPRQLESVSAPVKNDEVKPAPKAVAKPKKAEATPKKVEAAAPIMSEEEAEIAEYKKKLAEERAERDIKAYAQKKAQKDAAAKLKKK